MERKGKNGKGSRKIEMKKIENENYLQVTFSKRRLGIFNMASKLSILCGAELAILVFSPWGNLHSFGHPSVKSVIERFHNQDGQPSVATNGSDEAPEHLGARISELNRQHEELLSTLEVEKKRAKDLKKWEEDKSRQGELPWWDTPIQEMGVFELQQLMAYLKEFKENVAEQVGELMATTVMPM